MSFGRSDRRRSRKAQKEANRLAKERLNLQRERMDWQHDQMSIYDSRYGGLEQKMVNAANRGEVGNYQGVTDRASADVAQGFSNARGQERRRLAAYGIDPTSGQAASREREFSINRATATAGTANQARQQEKRRVDQEDRRNYRDAMRMGSKRYGLASAGIENAYSGIDRAYSGRINERQNASQMYARQADAKSSALGGAVGTVVGGTVGWMASGGNPMGAIAGAQMGSSALGGGGGGTVNLGNFGNQGSTSSGSSKMPSGNAFGGVTPFPEASSSMAPLSTAYQAPYSNSYGGSSGFNFNTNYGGS